jgi:hypothetical protein
MYRKFFRIKRAGLQRSLASAIMVAATWCVGIAGAQTATPPGELAQKEMSISSDASRGITEAPKTDSGVIQAGCSTCQGGLFGGTGGCIGCGTSGGCGPGCGGPGCIPGRLDGCCGCCGDTCVGRALCGIYECVCCPDPCYDPRWCALADAAFYSDGPRPVTQMRIRWDNHYDIPFADRGEYWWARESAKQAVPTGGCFPGASTGKGPNCVPSNIDVEDLSLYTEAAMGRFSAFVEIPYREVGVQQSDVLAANVAGMTCCNASGFTDMNVGTKSLLLDCELLQITFQFKTFIPIGNFTKGLGNAHVSLEPALLYAMKLTPDMYLQGETAYWIPIAGDSLYQGNLFHTHLSLNKVIWRILPNVQLIGTAEVSEYSFIGGNYTATNIFLPANAAGNTTGKAAPLAISATGSMCSIGPGVRLNICDRIDFGIGSQFSITGTDWAKEEFRAEFRWRF